MCWFERRASKEPEKLLPPDLVMTFTTPPVPLPYSASYPAVWREISWMASKTRLVENVWVTGSVVFRPSRRHWFCPRFEPIPCGFEPPAAPAAWPSTDWYERPAWPIAAYFRWSSLKFCWVVVCVGSTTTWLAVTVTTSVTAPSESFASCLVVWLRLMTMLDCTTGLRPCSSYSARYVPGGRGGRRWSPFAV